MVTSLTGPGLSWSNDILWTVTSNGVVMSSSSASQSTMVSHASAVDATSAFAWENHPQDNWSVSPSYVSYDPASDYVSPASALHSLELTLEFEYKLLIFLHLYFKLLYFNLEIYVLLEGGVDLIRGELCKPLFEKVYLELNIKVLFL